MAIRNIVTIEDPVLRKKSRPVVNFDEKLWTLLDDMKETLKKADGAGLAAVQVGILRRAVIVDVGDGKPLELINPEIVETSGEQEGQEGCLSLPGKWGVVRRPEFVKVRAQNRKGQWCMFKGEGLKARCFCHEIDHLDGIVFTDRAKRMLTDEELRRLNKED
ncbi:MAG: peptide deformylase [Oscillospiraceae bacterium]|nr:peptide deformylase [Oscillospiraceae bacterium]MDD7292262.1 peptide deformylase [Clostridiaceae bacterium]